MQSSTSLDHVVFTGVDPYVPRRPHVRGAIVHAHSMVYLGTHCHDGRPIEHSRRYRDAVRLGARIVKHTVVDAEDVAEDVAEKEATTKKSLLERYRPRKLASVIGHATEIEQLRTWIRAWPALGRVALIHGPPGIGKTTVAHLLGKEAGYTISEYNASDVRSVDALRRVLGTDGVCRLVREFLVMDEVDGLAERGGVVELAAIAQKTTAPILCIANELGGAKLKPLERVCGRQVIAFRPVPPAVLCPALEQLCRAEHIVGFTRTTLRTLYEETGGDIRHLLTHLTTTPSTESQKDKRPDDLYQTTAHLLRGSPLLSWEDAMNAVYHEEYMVPLMIQENYVHGSMDTLVSIDTLAEAADQWSVSDVARAMLGRTQDWSLLPVVVSQVVGASRRVAMARTNTDTGPRIRFPALLGKMSTQRKNRQWLDHQRIQGGRLDGTLELICRQHTTHLLDGSRESFHLVVEDLKDRGWTREDFTDMAATAFSLYPVVPTIPSRTKAAITRALGGSTGKRTAAPSDSDEDAAEDTVEDT